MRILVDILHPAHVHFFRNYIEMAIEAGDEVSVTSRDKDVTVLLLDAFHIEHDTISAQRKGNSGLAIEWARRTPKLFGIARRFEPDVLIGIMGVSIAPVARLLRKPSIVFYDTEVARRTNSIVYPMASVVATPDCYEGDPRANQITYPGYHELAYLHPNRFTPDGRVLNEFGIDDDEPYAVVRFVGQDSSHDGDEVALSDSSKIEMVRALEGRSRVVISSEAPLPHDIAHLRLEGPLHKIHHVLSFASTCVGESATMATEAAMLSTPSVFIGETSRGYVNELTERYGLIERFTPSTANAAIAAAVESIDATDSRTREEAHTRMLNDKIDVTAWIGTFMDGYR
ncbi:MAG: DUF354 domain-containing protein [Acidimicrobiia bacterium]|nr:MAG: DUF354 domain-containing protein [Acidimicrobiia bacterium]